MNIERDENLPYAAVDTSEEVVAARFAEKADADDYARHRPFVEVVYGGPLPDKAGVYSISKGVRTSRHFLLTTDGSWYWLDFTAHNAATVVESTNPEVVGRYADELQPKWVDA